MRLFDMDSKEDYLLDGKYKVATPDDPLVDVAEVVRCKDCYHAVVDDLPIKYVKYDIPHLFCLYFHSRVYEDDYCSNAVERRKDSKE